MIHPQEALLQEARAFQQSEAFTPYRKLPQAAEHRLARLMQLGARQARYFGRTKTLFQLLMAATVANLTLMAMRTGLMRDRNHPKTVISAHVRALLAVPIGFAACFCEFVSQSQALEPRLVPRFSATLLVVTMAGAAVVLAACGLGVGLAHALRSDDSSEITRLLGAQLASLPAVWVVAGLAVALFGLVPQAASLAWAALVGFLFLGILGPLLQLPDWTMDLSPFNHVPQVPSKELTVAPLIWLTAVAAALIATGLAAFRRRDIG